MSNAESHSNLHGPRTVALVGTYGSGKTTLFEALLEAAGTPLRHGGDAKPRIPGNETRLAHCSYLGDSWSVLDCPGSIEFSHETACALAVADLAVVVAEPDPVRAIALRPVFSMLEAADLPFIVFVNKTDTLAVSPEGTARRLAGRDAPAADAPAGADPRGGRDYGLCRSRFRARLSLPAQ